MRQLFLIALCVLSSLPAAAAPSLTVDAGSVTLAGGNLDLDVTVTDAVAGQTLKVIVLVDGKQVHEAWIEGGEQTLSVTGAELARGEHQIVVKSGTIEAATSVRAISGWWSILPPLIAIILALLLKDVVLSLFVGVLSGALILNAWNPITALARTIDQFITPALFDESHAKIIVFTILLGGMVGVISKSGGTRGIVERIRGFAVNRRRGQLATWFLGMSIFFDDYANSLIVGSTMRPITDRLKISREKLSYIVDSTAAPVASLVPISTWIGFEVGLIDAAFRQLSIDLNPYTVFIQSIPYRFYPILAILLVFVLAWTGRDFGPMLAAERRAAKSGKVLDDNAQPLGDFESAVLEPPKGAPLRAINAVLPIVTVITLTVVGLYRTGVASLVADAGSLAAAKAANEGVWLREVFAASDSYTTLLWSALAGLLVAIVLPLAQRILSVRESMASMVEGFKSMLLAFVVLILAWAVSSVCTELHTADFVVGLTEGVLSPHFLPALVFIVSAATAFATGSSWGTMGILIPLVIPVAHGLAGSAGLELGHGSYTVILLGTISSVLAGSIWGDHCSPISDTTILSSVASGADHIAHVKTQMPYAVAIAAVGLLIGDIPSAYGLSPWVSLVVSAVLVIVGVRFLGKPIDESARPNQV